MAKVQLKPNWSRERLREHALLASPTSQKHPCRWGPACPGSNPTQILKQAVKAEKQILYTLSIPPAAVSLFIVLL